MELDVLKEEWVEQDRKLDGNIRLNQQLLIAANMNRVRSPMRNITAPKSSVSIGTSS